MSKITSQANQDITCKTEGSEIGVKRSKFETVNQTVLSCKENFGETNGHKLVNLSKKTAINDDKVLHKYNDVTVTGLNYVHLIMIMIIINYINI